MTPNQGHVCFSAGPLRALAHHRVERNQSRSTFLNKQGDSVHDQTGYITFTRRYIWRPDSWRSCPCPLALAMGVASGLGPIAGLYGAIFVGFFAALFGGTEPQISGPTGPMTVVCAGPCCQYCFPPRSHGKYQSHIHRYYDGGTFSGCSGLI